MRFQLFSSVSYFSILFIKHRVSSCNYYEGKVRQLCLEHLYAIWKLKGSRETVGVFLKNTENYL
jgi:hypothetical protein